MANLRIQGDTSGYVDLTAPAVAGASVVDLGNVTRIDTAITADNSGNIGIGTASPSTILHAVATSGAIRIQNNASVAKYLQIKSDIANSHLEHIGGPGDALRINNQASGTIEFLTANTERMRIDSSGNLLVGKTAANNSTVGVQAMADGSINGTVTSDTVSRLNRLSTDGEILRFQKNTTAIGSIGVESGDNFYIDALTGGGAGLTFWGAGGTAPLITPRKEGVNSDAEVDIGRSANRFKNLYLSGGVFLGGTGAANYLDDYEEGTFNTGITFGGVAPAGLSIFSATSGYVKIGRIVLCTMGFGANWSSSASGALRITGLPFTEARGGGYIEPGFAIGNKSASNFTHAAVVASTTELVCYKDGVGNTFVNTDFNNGGASTFWFHGSLVYMTDQP